MQDCLRAFGKDIEAISESYYSAFAEYLTWRRPDVVGHFDLLTKYDEMGERYFLGNPTHDRIAEHFIERVAREGMLFEVNTGAIARGYRTSPYPSVNLLRKIKDSGAPITLTSDCHNAEYLDCHFRETKSMLYDIGFRETVVLYNHKFTKMPLTP